MYFHVDYAILINFGASQTYIFWKTFDISKSNHWLFVPRSEDLLLWYGFLKFHVMRISGINLYDIVHVKVDFILVLKMYLLVIKGRFVWTERFEQCDRSGHYRKMFFSDSTHPLHQGRSNSGIERSFRSNPGKIFKLFLIFSHSN